MYANWLYFLGDKGKKPKETETVFLYGLSIPTNYDTEMNSTYKKIGKLKDNDIYLYQSVTKCKPIEENFINFSEINNKCSSKIYIISKQRFIQNHQHYNVDIPESPIHSTVNMNVYYTNDFYNFEDGKYLKDKNKSELKDILEILEKDSSQHFKKGYAKRIGCYEVAEIQPWAETKTPFHLKTTRKPLNNYIFTRKSSSEDIFIHLIVYSLSKEILLDEFKKINQGENEIIFNAEVKNDASYEYWLFNSQGKIIHKDKANWLLGIEMQMNVVSKTVKNVPYQNGKTKDVTIFTPTPGIKIDYPDNKTEKIIENRSNEIYNLAQLTQNQNNIRQVGKWFNKPENDVTHLIKYLENSITDIRSLTIIDPFISDESIMPLSHFKNNSIAINIISCWGDEDPDTSERKSKEDIKKSTINYIKEIKDYGLSSSNITWHDFPYKKFHDRYVLLENNTDKEVFLISNSLNNILKNYDNVCIVRLENILKENSISYISTLISDCSDNNRLYPEVLNDN